MEQAAVSALEAVGSALEAALQALVAFVRAAVVALLQPLSQHITSGVAAYDDSLDTPLGSAFTTVQGGGTVTPQEASAVGQALSGGPFLFGLGLGVAVAIGLTLATPLDLGPSFLVGILLSLVVGAALSYAPVVQGAEDLSSAAVYAIEKLIEGIPGNAGTIDKANWEVVAEVIGLVAAGAEVPYSWFLLAQEWKVNQGADPSLVALSMAIAFVAIVVGLIAVAQASTLTLLLVFTLAMMTLAVLTLHFFHSAAANVPSLKGLGLIDVLIGASGAVAAAVALGIKVT